MVGEFSFIVVNTITNSQEKEISSFFDVGEDYEKAFIGGEAVWLFDSCHIWEWNWLCKGYEIPNIIVRTRV